MHLEQALKMRGLHLDRELRRVWAGDVQENVRSLIFSLWSPGEKMKVGG